MRGSVGGWVLAVLLAGWAQPGPAIAQPRPAAPAPSPGDAPSPPARAPAANAPPAKPADPAFEAARTTFEALPEAERKALQDALVWTGDFNAVVSGAFGRRTFEALQAFAARSGGDPLGPGGRGAIRAAGEAARRAARFRIQADPASGVVLGVPEALLSRRTAMPAGTRWQSADGRVTLETRAYPPGTETLDGLFERATAPLNGRKVTYRLRKPDFVVVTAETGVGQSYTRYAAGASGVRGLLIGYDRALAGEVDRLVIAVANAFDPFPAAAAPSPVSAAPSAPVPAAGPARIVATATAVAPGRFLTVAAPGGCPAPRIGDREARVVASDPSGLTVVEVPAGRTPALTVEAAPAGGSVIGLAAGADGTMAVPGTLEGDRVTAPLQPGAAGAPLIDREGRLAGLVASYPETPRLVAGVAPPTSLPVVPATTVAAFLAGRGIAPGKAHGGVPAAAPAILPLTCR